MKRILTTILLLLLVFCVPTYAQFKGGLFDKEPTTGTVSVKTDGSQPPFVEIASRNQRAFIAATIKRQVTALVASQLDTGTADPSNPSGGTIRYRSDLGTVKFYDAVGSAWRTVATTSTAAPINATYITQTANSTLTNEQATGSLASALLVNTTTTGVLSAYAGTTCTNQFIRSMNALGAATCASVSLTADVSGRLPFANLTQGSALSVLGVTGNATADVASIVAGTDNQVLRRSGTSIAFGAVNLASSNAVAGALPAANGGTGLSALGTALQQLRVNAGATALEYFTASAGITNSAGNNVIPKSDGTNLVGSRIRESGNNVIVNGASGSFQVDDNVGGVEFSINPTAGLTYQSDAGGDAVWEIDVSGASPVFTQGGSGGNTLFVQNDAAKTFNFTVSTETLTIDGTAHTVALAAATSINLASTTITTNSLPLEQTLSSTASVNMNTATATTLYTCPSGKSCVITKVVVRNASTSLTTASYSFGWNSASFNDVIANATHTELTGSTLYSILLPKAGATLGTTTGTFKVLMNTLQGGAATTTIDVVGYIF